MEVSIAKDMEELSRQFAGWMVSYIRHRLLQQPTCSIVLSGGSTPKKLYQLLASDAYTTKIEWKRLHFFWGDERCVPFTDERNNAKMAFDTLLDLVPVDEKNIHVMRTDIEPAAAATEYEELLHRYFNGQAQSFDLVLLGLGDNAHTLSLFPGYPIIHEKENWVSAFYLKEQDMYRISLTAPVVNQAAAVAFLLGGADKAKAFREVIQGTYDPDRYPAQLIRPVNGHLHWWVDEAAASELQTD